jgi:tetratricopeptide (TPR) repeat protein
MTQRLSQRKTSRDATAVLFDALSIAGCCLTLSATSVLPGLAQATLPGSAAGARLNDASQPAQSQVPSATQAAPQDGSTPQPADTPPQPAVSPPPQQSQPQVSPQKLPPASGLQRPNNQAGGVPTYFLQGKQVSFERFQAAKLASDALTLMRNNQNEGAAEKLRQAIVLAPDMAEAHHNLGLVLAKLGDVPHAIDELNLAIKYKPDLDSSWLTLGGIHQSVGHIDQAVEIYQKFLIKFPKHPMHDKIHQLVEGLKNEKGEIATARHEDAQLALGQPPAQGVLQVPGVQAEDDYLAEVTHNGVFRWPEDRLPIKVYLWSAEDARGNPGIAGYRREFKDILVGSFSEWTRASGGKVKFQFVDSPREANLECSWAADSSSLKNPAEAGEAQVYTDAQGIARSKVVLLTRSISPVLPLTTRRLRVICLHEIGHALGLAGHTTNPEDIMFFSVSFKDEWRELSGRDSRTIQRLYSSK